MAIILQIRIAILWSSLKKNKLVQKLFFLSLVLFYSAVCFGQAFSFDSILNGSPALKCINSDFKKHRLQIIYTHIERNEKGAPSFKNYTHHLDSANYFYCASLVKLPCSILALEKLNDLKIDKFATMFTDSAGACQHSSKTDTSSISGLPSVGHYIKRMLLVSDNFAYGRIYEFLGAEYIHRRLEYLGFKNMRIVRRFDGGCIGKESTTTNPVSFYNPDLKLIYHQKQQVQAKNRSNPLGVIKIGDAYISPNGKQITGAMDFTNMNYMSLENIHSILQRLVFNTYFPKAKQYKITKEDQEFLIQNLTFYPRESLSPSYNTTIYFDSYKKYFIFGDSIKTITNEEIKITNIVGQSYGFTIDCAYIQNKKENVEFMLSAVLYTNEDGIMNDGKYEYYSVARPFLAELGRVFCNYEIENKLRNRIEK